MHFFPCRGHRDDDEEQIVNYDGNETVSLSGVSSAGSAGVGEKTDLSTTPSTGGASDRSYQNPTYGTSEFMGEGSAPDDQSLANPIYETISTPDNSEEDEMPEKVAPTEADFAVPMEDDKLLVATTTAANFAVPTEDHKPLIATTTAAGTTTVHVGGGGGRYEPARPVPMEVGSEPPLYATVVPKHKRATAKPFAADDEDDESD